MTRANTSQRRWYAVIVRSQMDERVARDLCDNGYEVFLPWTFTRSKTSNRAWVEASLRLTPYLFVAVDASAGQDLGLVNDTNGVVEVVSLSLHGGDDTRYPSEVPAAMIEGMRREQIAEFEEAKRRVRRKESCYTAGEEIEIRSPHQFAGHRGTVKSARHGSLLAEIGPNKFPVWLRETDVSPMRAIAKGRAA